MNKLAHGLLVAALLVVPASRAGAQASDADAPDTGTSTSTTTGSDSATEVHTTSRTTTSSGRRPASTEPDHAGAPVVDRMTQPGPSAAPAEEEEEEGDGRDVDFIWIEAQGGVANVNLIQFSNSSFADVAAGTGSVFNEVYGTGPMVGVGVGFRIWWLAIGARTSFAGYDGFQIGTVGGEATLRFPIPIVEPWVRVGFGYAWQGDANYRSATTSNTTTYGWTFQSALGLDFFLANWFTLGAGFGLDVLNMSRQRDPSVMCMGVTDVCPGNPGDALGLQLKGFATIGLHF